MSLRKEFKQLKDEVFHPSLWEEGRNTPSNMFNTVLSVRSNTARLHIVSHISERSSSTKWNLNESTKRNAWLSLHNASPRQATNSEEFHVV